MCYNPNTVQILTYKESGEVISIFHRGVWQHNYEDEKLISECFSVPCGECIECLEQYSNVWAYRCVLESKCHKENCMITLTYAPEHNPVTLVRRDIQLFLKRLRRAHSDISIRYFGCGEYGGQNLRPHFHVLIFGYKPKDLLPFKKDKSGHQLFLSMEISELWGKGFISVADCNMYTAKYSAKYLQKLRPVPGVLKPAFTFMSLKPGIGYGALHESNFVTDKLYVDGKVVSLPRYFVSKGSEAQKNFIHLGRVVKADLMSNRCAEREANYLLKKRIFGKIKK